ncbi:MAG: hypothetical protein AAF682_24650 [Planctomycetota bacterium]
MNTRFCFYTLAAAAGAGSLASAQLGEVMICDPINEHVYRLSDLNGDGDYLDANETTLLLDFATEGFFNPEGAEVRDEAGTPVVYAVSDFPDGLYRGADANGDGVINTGEYTFFVDSQTLFGGGMDATDVTLTDDGAVWLSSGFETVEGLFRSEDLNADGDANDAGETVQMVSATPHPVETDAGVVPIAGDDMWRMARDGNGVVVYCGFSSSSTADEDSIFRFEDLNGDGDVLDAGESKLFLNYTGKNPALPVNPDFGTVLPTQEIPNIDSPSTPFYNRLNHVEVRDNAGTTEYFFACDASSTSIFSTSVTGDVINALVFRGVDNNLDGDVNDAGEVTIYYDGSVDGPLGLGEQIDKIVGMGEDDGWLYLADATGARINRIKDMNGDGDAMDAGEIEMDLWSFGAWGFNPPIVDPLGPFVENIEAGPNGLFPPASANFTTSGVGCSTFAPGPPAIGATGNAQIGTSNFTCSVSNTASFAPALLAYGLSNTDYLGLPLPLDLSFVPGLGGCLLYQSLTGDISATTDGTGGASTVIPVPNDPALVNIPVYLQWLIIQPGVVVEFALSDLGTVLIESCLVSGTVSSRIPASFC